MVDKPSLLSKLTYKVLPKDYFSELKKRAKARANETLVAFAESVAEDVKKTVEEQKLKWAPLSPEYLKHKKDKGLDERILIATRDYLDNGIGVYKKDNYVVVGPLPGKHKDSDLSYQDLAMFLEYGTENMPARPLWRPLRAEAKEKIKSFKKDYARKVVKDAKEKAKAAKKLTKDR